jgi:ribosomal protein S18 acetylase RimI-like enzyme
MEVTMIPLKEEYVEEKGRAHYRVFVQTYQGKMPAPYLAQLTEEQFIRWTREKPGKTVLALIQGKVAGFLRYSQGEAGTQIHALYLLEEYQGKGLGRKLMEHCLSLSPGRPVRLFVLRENQKAQGFYRAMGFAPTGREQREHTPWGDIIELEMERAF